MTTEFYALGLYAGLLGLIAMWLVAAVGTVKNKANISIGDGGNPDVIRAMRGQANFVENVPMILILLAIATSMGMPVLAIHVIGITLVIGRILHGLHFVKKDAPAWQRMAGFMATFLSMAACSLGLIGYAIAAMI